MRTLNTAEFYRAIYYSYDGYLSQLNGVYTGHEINFMAVGMGFAARGWSVDQMFSAIYGWKDSQFLWYGISGQWSRLPYSGIRGGELMWATLGYTYYQNGGHL
jgi:hypothetical protein